MEKERKKSRKPQGPTLRRLFIARIGMLRAPASRNYLGHSRADFGAWGPVVSDTVHVGAARGR